MSIPVDIPDPAVMNTREPQVMLCDEKITEAMMGILLSQECFLRYVISGGYQYRHNFRRVYAEIREEGFHSLSEPVQARFIAVLGEKR